MSRSEQRRFAAAAWLAAPAVELCLATAGLHRTLRWLEATSPQSTGAGHGAAPVTPEEGAALVHGIYRLHLLRGACLPRSLLQYWLHRRAGTPVRFVVGVRRPESAPEQPLEAHAWVEWPGVDEAIATREMTEGSFETLLVRETPRTAFGEGRAT